MGKKPVHQPKLKKKFYPIVSVCTPTFNRRPFIPIMFECFRAQTYPKDRIEWIIVDDGTDRIKDLIDKANIPQIKYFEVNEKMSLGAKRNFMHSKCSGTIIVYMDDDDYYPPERISHAVEKLTENKEALCAGSSEMYVYFKHIGQMWQCGPYGPNHATAGTFAFRKEMLRDTKYEDHAALAEEKAFLKNYTIPFVQLDPHKTILVFSHEHNTFDKRKLLSNPHPDYMKVSPKTVDDFIKRPEEAHIKKFFLHDIDALLEKYEPGDPKNKPDVLKQIVEIEKRMEEEVAKHNAQNAQIMIQQPGQQPTPLTPQQIIEIMNQQSGEIQRLTQRVKELEEVNVKLQEMMYKKSMPGGGIGAMPIQSQSMPPFVFPGQTASQPQPPPIIPWQQPTTNPFIFPGQREPTVPF